MLVDELQLTIDPLISFVRLPIDVPRHDRQGRGHRGNGTEGNVTLPPLPNADSSREILEGAIAAEGFKMAELALRLFLKPFTNGCPQWLNRLGSKGFADRRTATLPEAREVDVPLKTVRYSDGGFVRPSTRGAGT